jgi:hypothetical protein
MRALIVLLLGCVFCSICSCIQPRPEGKYPTARDEVIRERLEAYEGKDRE